MRTHRFGRKLKLPATIAIKHQLRRLMVADTLENTEAAASVKSSRGQPSDETPPPFRPENTGTST